VRNDTGDWGMLDSPVAGGCILALMLSIGRFADATGLTVKALRHYDEIGLLEPARVDPHNGYRYYDAAQIEDAVTIRRLRALELPLDEIRELLRADAHALRDRLAAHGYRVAEEVRDKHSLLIELSALVEGGAEPVVVQIRDEPALQLAANATALGQGLRFAQPIRIEYLEPDVRARIVWPLASVIYAL
jgi:DNA-binding transcriptional MerR regulator